jgi:HlyD family secretion protein
VDVEPGDLLSPDAASPAVVVADVSKLRVRAFVEETDAPRVRTDLAARVTVDGLPGKEFTGVVSDVSPRMSEKQHFDGNPEELYDTMVREVLIDLTYDAALVIGLRVDVVLHAASR